MFVLSISLSQVQKNCMIQTSGVVTRRAIFPQRISMFVECKNMFVRTVNYSLFIYCIFLDKRVPESIESVDDQLEIQQLIACTFRFAL